MLTARVLDAGDAAFTVEFGSTVDPALLAAVQALDAAIAGLQTNGRLPGLIETMPTFRSLTVFFDPLIATRQELVAAIAPLLDGSTPPVIVAGRRWRLPVCYEGEAGPDLVDTARAIGASVDEVVAWHSGTEVQVYMLGFLPGFAFMGKVHERLNLPRRPEPRLRVPAGSVSIAGGQTAIYPWESPGGWHLLGRCPVPLFDAARAAPALLAAGDRVQFEPVSTAEYLRLVPALKAGQIDPLQWRLEAGSGADRA